MNGLVIFSSGSLLFPALCLRGGECQQMKELECKWMKEWLKEIFGTYFKKVLHEDYILFKRNF